MDRMKLVLSNGILFSVFRDDEKHHLGSYEVAALDAKSLEWMTKTVWPEATDDVISWLTGDEVVEYLVRAKAFTS